MQTRLLAACRRANRGLSQVRRGAEGEAARKGVASAARARYDGNADSAHAGPCDTGRHGILCNRRAATRKAASDNDGRPRHTGGGRQGEGWSFTGDLLGNDSRLVLSGSFVCRHQMYDEVKREIAAGGRAFIIYPLIEESSAEKLAEVKAAEKEYANLQQSMKLGEGVQCGLLHGRMSADEKQAAIGRFVSGETPVLVSTSLVEASEVQKRRPAVLRHVCAARGNGDRCPVPQVGMDVPEASVMIVNHAERFGLAQLHQLRGRVGRGERQSRCFLVNAGDSAALRRLKVLAAEHSGLRIAEADMAHRCGTLAGPSPHPQRIEAQLPSDMHCFAEARVM